MTTPRKSKVKSFSWADLGLSKPQGLALEKGCTPVQASKCVTVPLPGLHEVVLARDDEGDLLRSPFGGSTLSSCFEGAPERVAERLVAGELPGRLVVKPEKAAEALAMAFPVLHSWWYGVPEDRRCPEWERAMGALGLPTNRPSWTGTIAGAFARGYLTEVEAAALGEGHSLAALKTLEQSKVEADQLLRGALTESAMRMGAATKAAAEILANVEAELLSARRKAALDLTDDLFDRDGAWLDVLEGEVLKAYRFRIRIRIGTDYYVVDVDRGSDTIEVVRSRDAQSWQLSEALLDSVDPADPEYEGIIDPLVEALTPFNADGDGYLDLEGDLAPMLLQHRARCALEKLRAPAQDLGHQLVLEL